MKWEMEIMSPVSSYHSESNWFVEESRSRRWTPEENKMFENALAYYDKETPDRWQKVAAMIPGKTVGDVMKQYKELEDDVSSIEAGLVPIPGYSTSPFTLDWGTSHAFDGFKPSYASAGKRSSAAGRPSEQERKKGIPWTEEEHKLFLLGLKKYGKGDWRNISRNFVVTRTPTQVASHAQKYFIRQLSGGKDKRRASIHDITTVNLNDADQTLSSPDSQRPSPDSGSVQQQTPFGQWNQQNGGAAMALNPRNGNMFVATYGLNTSKLQAQSMQTSAMQESYFQMQSAHNYPHGFADAS